MKLLAEISEASLGIGNTEILKREFVLRKSARAILRNADGAIAIQHLTVQGIYKLPGGGVEPGESLEDTLHRELREEVGCAVRIVRELGCVIEYHTEEHRIHISYCFVADIDGAIGTPVLEADEIEAGLTTLWLTPEETIAHLTNDASWLYQAPFIRARELAFLQEYMNS